MRRATGILAALAVLAGQRVSAEPVSLTFDDVPGLSLSMSPAYGQTTNRKLTDGLRRLNIPAVGFVVGDKFANQPLARESLIAPWKRAPLALGNHTYSHLSPNQASPDDYLKDVDRDSALLVSLAGAGAPRWFRYPYLETGPNQAARDAIAWGLKARGYRTAPVTLENDDDTFAPVYDEAVVNGDWRRTAQLRARYLRFTEQRIAWYRRAALELLGRRPSLIFLLHDTRLNADCLPALAAALRRNGLQPVSLGEALRDPAYAQPDGPATTDGDDWLNRWAVTLKHDLPWDDFPEAPADIAAAAAHLDPAP